MGYAIGRHGQDAHATGGIALGTGPRAKRGKGAARSACASKLHTLPKSGTCGKTAG